MRPLLVIILFSLAACVSDARHATSSMSDGTLIHTIRCEKDWDACYLAAGRLCGDRGFEEVARNVDTSLSSAGRLERMHTTEGGIDRHRYSENTQEERYNRLITIRCNRPR
jgi:hypothetical protein